MIMTHLALVLLSALAPADTHVPHPGPPPVLRSEPSEPARLPTLAEMLRYAIGPKDYGWYADAPRKGKPGGLDVFLTFGGLRGDREATLGVFVIVPKGKGKRKPPITLDVRLRFDPAR